MPLRWAVLGPGPFEVWAPRVVELKRLVAHYLAVLRTHRLIIAARALAGMSQSELAAAAGIALSVLQAIEQGRSDPKLKTVLALLDVLKARGVELLVEEGRIACGVYVAIGSEADLAGSIRPVAPAHEPKPEATIARASAPHARKKAKPGTGST